MRTRFCQNYFSGDLDLAKPRLNFPPAERGLGNECGRVSDWGFLEIRRLIILQSSVLVAEVAESLSVGKEYFSPKTRHYYFRII